MKIALDTNVLVSGTFWTGKSFEILKRIDLNEIKLVLSKEIIEEYYETINNDEIVEKIKDKDLVINEVSQKVISNAIIIEPNIKFDVIKEDADDNKILECAFEGKAEYIISQDNHLLKLKEFKGIKIITPEEFLRIINNHNKT